MNKQTFLDKLYVKKPANFKKYSYDLLPNEFKGTDIIPIECYSHGIFHQKAFGHLHGMGVGCMGCAREGYLTNMVENTEDFIKKSVKKFGPKYGYGKTKYVKKGVDLIITCPTHGDFLIRPEAHMWSKHGCPKCDYEIPRTIRMKKMIEKATKVHQGRYDYSKVSYWKFNDTVEIICPTHGSFFQRFYDHVYRPIGCAECGRDNYRLTVDKFIARSREIHGDAYDYSKVSFENNQDKVTITCKKHGDFIQRVGSHLAGNTCKDCFLERNRSNKEEFIKAAREIHGDKYDYSRVNYKQSKIPVELICPTHGSFWLRPNSHLSSRSGCKFCIESKGETAVSVILDKYSIKYIREYKIKPHMYRYDFFLPDTNIFIEYNGHQHYRPVELFGGEKGFREIVERDKIKKQLVSLVKGRLIIISYKFSDIVSIEKELIRSLKRLYNYWFVINGEVKAYKSALDVYNAFNIPKEVLVKDLVSKVEMSVPNLRVLF